jgi:dienelactone hydrolase
MMKPHCVMVGNGPRSVNEGAEVKTLSRRDCLRLSVAAHVGSSWCGAAPAGAGESDLHEQILDLAAQHERKRRARFAGVTTNARLSALQSSLRETFLRLLDGFPQRDGPPQVHRTGTIDAGDFIIEKLVYQSLPGYYVPALVYRPRRSSGPLPGVLSPCGHSASGKAEKTYQILHINLAQRGFVVLTYDPVGQGERSQFWDPGRARSRYNLVCGEHAVLGNPLYLLGTNLARYRIWDGMRGLDLLTSLPEVDAARIGCVGNSGGGTLSAYISALDSRVTVSAICCYVTTLRRRMANRIQEDPAADPEQDLFGFVSDGLDHAGLLALRVPKPTLLGTARFDFFPIEGARKTFTEVRRLYELAGAPEALARVEAAERHGLTLPLRNAVYAWFHRWLAGAQAPQPVAELAVAPRSARELQVCAEGQVNRSFASRPLLPLALEAFDRALPVPRALDRQAFARDVLQLDTERADPRVTEISQASAPAGMVVVCINGNEARDWRDETAFLDGLARRGHAAIVVDPRGVGSRKARLSVVGKRYDDPLRGVEENLAYNAFLVGTSLIGMRVSDTLAALRALAVRSKPSHIVLCGRRDSALTACLAGLVEPGVERVVAEEILLSFRGLFAAEGRAVNAASILPGFLRHFRDLSDLFAAIAPRKVLVSAGVGEARANLDPSVHAVKQRVSEHVGVLTDWLSNS